MCGSDINNWDAWLTQGSGGCTWSGTERKTPSGPRRGSSGPQAEELKLKLAVGGVPDTSTCETFLDEHSHGIYVEKDPPSKDGSYTTRPKSLAIFLIQEGVFRTDPGIRSRLSDIRSMKVEVMILAWLPQFPQNHRPDAEQRRKRSPVEKSKENWKHSPRVRGQHPTPKTKEALGELQSTGLAQRQGCVSIRTCFSEGVFCRALLCRPAEQILSQWTCKARNPASHCIFNTCLFYDFADPPHVSMETTD